MLTKEECKFALQRLYSLKNGVRNLYPIVETETLLDSITNDRELLEQIIEEYFDNKLIWLEKVMDKDTFDLIFSCEENVKEWHERMMYNNRKLHELFEEVEVLKSNPPLKFEELKEGMYVWDDHEQQHLIISRVVKREEKIIAYFEYGVTAEFFEEGRFYRKQVEE